ncbi:FliH/SctL family protein [Salinisphaera sp. G21_0]|uniref:FliH/SctL family protein n=1 Tax=Salinisphaera sp. G21_0 TaxID=2821094 RepID=UPI001ADD372D|nr:FliH/SctL family protein [Salinisphaera sp. G21_0]MBO9480838.1 hypothetical protein [Salinisphaera sp. G21_0]
MKNRNRIWQPETAAYKRFQFPVHDRESIQERTGGASTENEADIFKEKSYQTHSIKPEPTVPNSNNRQSSDAVEKARAENHAAQMQKIEKQSYQRGYEEGRRLGFEEASGKVASQVQQASEQHKAFFESLHKELASLQTEHLKNREQLSIWLGQVVEEVCRQVVRTEVSTQQGQIVEIIRQTLDLIPESDEYSIHVCEQDAELLREVKPDFGIPWQLSVSQELTPGDCRIVASDGEADARLESRLMQCLDIIRESLPANLEAVTS